MEAGLWKIHLFTNPELLNHSPPAVNLMEYAAAVPSRHRRCHGGRNPVCALRSGSGGHLRRDSVAEMHLALLELPHRRRAGDPQIHAVAALQNSARERPDPQRAPWSGDAESNALRGDRAPVSWAAPRDPQRARDSVEAEARESIAPALGTTHCKIKLQPSRSVAAKADADYRLDLPGSRQEAPLGTSARSKVTRTPSAAWATASG